MKSIEETTANGKQPKHALKSNSEQRKNSLSKYLAYCLIALAVSAALAVGLDYICYLVLGETSAGTWYDKYWMGFFFCCFVIVASFIVLRGCLAEKPEYLYLIIVCTCGLFMAWSLSCYSEAWDTEIHFRNVLGWADIDDEFELSTSELAFITKSISATAGIDLPLNLEGLYHMEAWLNANCEDVANVRTAYSFWNVLTAVNYIPPAIVMFFCELADLPFTTSYFLSLIPCVLIYGLVTFFGMKKLQSGKMLYAVIALFPTGIFLVANYGYQYWNMAFFMYAFAYLASFLQRRTHVPLREIVFMLVAFVLASLPRLSYAPLILLSLLVPKECFSSKRLSIVYRVGIVVTTVVVASIYAVPRMINGLGAGDSRGGGDVNPAAQLEYILSNPLEYIQRLVEYLAPPYVLTDETTYANDYVSGYLSLRGSIRFIGFYGYLGYIAYPFFIVVLLLLAFTTFTDKDGKTKYGVTPSVASIAVSFVIIVAIITALYIDFNNVGEDAFRGVQGRYLLPLVYPTLVFLGHHKWGLNGSKIPSSIYNGAVLGIMAFVVMGSWWQVYLVNIY